MCLESCAKNHPCPMIKWLQFCSCYNLKSNYKMHLANESENYSSPINYTLFICVPLFACVFHCVSLYLIHCVFRSRNRNRWCNGIGLVKYFFLHWSSRKSIFCNFFHFHSQILSTMQSSFNFCVKLIMRKCVVVYTKAFIVVIQYLKMH